MMKQKIYMMDSKQKLLISSLNCFKIINGLLNRLRHFFMNDKNATSLLSVCLHFCPALLIMVVCKCPRLLKPQVHEFLLIHFASKLVQIHSTNCLELDHHWSHRPSVGLICVPSTSYYYQKQQLLFVLVQTCPQIHLHAICFLFTQM